MPITWSPTPTGSLAYPDAPVGSIVAGAAARYGDRTAFAHHGQERSFAEVYRGACRFANALRAHGFGPGDTIAIHLPNCLAYPVAYYGTLLAGAAFTPANPLLPGPALAAQLADSGAVAAVTFGRGAKVLADVGEQTRIRVVVVTEPDGELTAGQQDFTEFHRNHPADPPEAAVDPRTALAHLAYTGGTTGRSKGVRLFHRNVVVNSFQYACWGSGSVPVLDADGNPVLDQVGAEDEWPVRLGTGRLINQTPWFHAMGTIGGLNVPMLSGTTVVLHDRFDPPAYLAEAERRRVTSLNGAPALFAALLACPDLATRDLSSVRTITSGAAPMPHEMLDALHRRFPGVVIAEGYGMTEVTMGATQGPCARSATRKPGTVGLPVFDTEIKIVAADGGEDPLPRGERGEICVRGPQVMAGYHDRPDETATVLVDGWLHSGDIGILDSDGYLSIVDRKKDMLIYKGYNVYPRELEELLLSQPGVASAAVVGRPRTGIGELPVAFVVRAPGANGLTEEGLTGAINEKVLPYQRLRELHFVDEIPVSAAGKILKRNLRDRLNQR